MLRRLIGAVSVTVIASLALCLALAVPSLAGELGHPVDGQLGLQAAATSNMEMIHTLYDTVNYIIIVIALFVLALLLYVMFRFNEKANPTPSKTTHNTTLEVAWTIIPILILVAIAIPSFKLLYYQYSFPKPDLTIKAIAMQWSWDHEYMDQGFTVSSNMLRDEDVLKAKLGDEFKAKYGNLDGLARLQKIHEDAVPVWKERGELRQLTVDQEIAIPVGKVVHMLVTSNDVIHSWTIPSFGVKQQAVPGRTAALWFQADKKGVYYGQCSVLCGKAHSGMPIVVHVVDQPVYDAWVAARKAKDAKKAKEILKTALTADLGDAPKTLAQAH